WSSIMLPANKQLTISKIHKGLRVYIAVRGSLDTERVLGSVSTDSIAKVGTIISKEQRIAIDRLSKPKKVNNITKSTDIPTYGSPWEIRICPGPDLRDYLSTFTNKTYIISPESNNVGIRLSGEPIKNHQPTEVL